MIGLLKSSIVFIEGQITGKNFCHFDEWNLKIYKKISKGGGALGFPNLGVKPKKRRRKPKTELQIKDA